MPIKRIDHIAIVVPNIEEAQTFYQNVLGLELSHVEQVDEQEAIVAFFPTGESEIELVEPITQASGIARYLSKRGPGIHHICVEVEDIQKTLADLKQHNVELINQEPTIGSGGKKIAFIHPHSTFGVLIELYESSPDEPVRRATIIEDLRTRLDVERMALSAGMTAFLGRLRAVSRKPASDDVGIKLKSEGQILDPDM
jgi:methylmalonyl-CoA epimerase